MPRPIHPSRLVASLLVAIPAVGASADEPSPRDAAPPSSFRAQAPLTLGRVAVIEASEAPGAEGIDAWAPEPLALPEPVAAPVAALPEMPAAWERPGGATSLTNLWLAPNFGLRIAPANLQLLPGERGGNGGVPGLRAAFVLRF